MDCPKENDPRFNPHAGKTTRAGQNSFDWDNYRANHAKIDWRKPPTCYKKLYRDVSATCRKCDFKEKCEKGMVK